jgi:thiosulfate oxidation carrier complex protein SoxZ
MKQAAIKTYPYLAPFAQRRRLLQGAAAMVFLCTDGHSMAKAAAGVDLADTFVADTFAASIAALGGLPVSSSLITISAPSIAESGASVPVTVSSTLHGAREILLLVDSNPRPVAAWFTISSGTAPFVSTRIRMAGNGTLYVVIRTDDGGLYAATQVIGVTVGGCGFEQEGDSLDMPSVGAIRIRGGLDNEGVANFRILMPHPMETGMRLDKDGRLVPPHYITDITATLAERLVFSARLSIAVSSNPLIAFRVAGAKVGQSLRVVWKDTRGDSRANESVVIA